MKLDIKTIIILALILFCTISSYYWLIKGDTESKEKLKEYETEFKKLEKIKDSLDISISNLKIKYKELDKQEDLLEEQNLVLSKRASKAEADAKHSKKDLEELLKKQKKTLEEIEKLKKNPIKREGDDLLESLKNKTK